MAGAPEAEDRDEAAVKHWDLVQAAVYLWKGDEAAADVIRERRGDTGRRLRDWARGVTGKVEVRDGRTGQVRTRVDVEEAARWRMTERNRDGLRRERYTPQPRETGIADPAATPLPEEPATAQDAAA